MPSMQEFGLPVKCVEELEEMDEALKNVEKRGALVSIDFFPFSI